MSGYHDDFVTTPGPPPQQPDSDENNIYGPGFHAFRKSDGFGMTWDGGGIVGKEVEAEISEDEFNRLRDDPSAFYEIALAHDPNK